MRSRHGQSINFLPFSRLTCDKFYTFMHSTRQCAVSLDGIQHHACEVSLSMSLRKGTQPRPSGETEIGIKKPLASNRDEMKHFPCLYVFTQNPLL